MISSVKKESLYVMQKNSYIIRLFLWYIYPAAIYYDNLNLDIVCWSFRVIAKIPFGIVSVLLKKVQYWHKIYWVLMLSWLQNTQKIVHQFLHFFITYFKSTFTMRKGFFFCNYVKWPDYHYYTILFQQNEKMNSTVTFP